MTVSELKSAIKSKKIKNFYIFTGDEVGVMDIYINKLASLKNLTVNRGESLSTVYKFLIKSLLSLNIFVMYLEMRKI